MSTAAQKVVANPSSVYNQSGTNFFPENTREKNVHNLLPVGVYKINFSMMHGFYLSQSEGFDMPPKIYGNANNTADRILNTFMDRPGTTGALLVGEKGSGKTLTAKQVCNKALERGVPVLKVEQSFSGSSFNDFIQSLSQPCVVLFDEFEKTYEDEKQAELLTLFDGTVSTKKLFLLTSNSQSQISDFMINRPGRIFYLLEYEGLDLNFIREYCEDNLKDKSKATGVLMCSGMFSRFTFDILKAMVEEINRYDETAMEVLEVLNVDAGNSRNVFRVKVFKDGEALSPMLYSSTSSVETPLNISSIPLVIHGQKALDAIAVASEMTTPPKAVFGIKKDVVLEIDSKNLYDFNANGEYCYKTAHENIEIRVSRVNREVRVFSKINF